MSLASAGPDVMVKKVSLASVDPDVKDLAKKMSLVSVETDVGEKEDAANTKVKIDPEVKSKRVAEVEEEPRTKVKKTAERIGIVMEKAVGAEVKVVDVGL